MVGHYTYNSAQFSFAQKDSRLPTQVKTGTPLTNMEPIKILLADDHDILLESLSLLLGRIAGIEVVGMVGDGLQALDFLKKTDVDLVLADLNMPLLNGSGLVWEIRQHHPTIRVLILTMTEDVDKIRGAIHNGVDGYVFKRSNKVELERAIRTVMAGQKYFGNEVIQKIASLPSEASTTGQLQTDELKQLTRREKEVMLLIIQGLTNQEIAERMFRSQLTVETHRKNIFQKLGVNSAMGLMRYAMQNGIEVN